MSSGVLIALALALLCVGGALLLWQRGAQSKGRASAERFIDSRMASAAAASALGAGALGGVGGVGGASAAGANGQNGTGAARAAAQQRAAAAPAPGIVIAPPLPPPNSGWLAHVRYWEARAVFIARHAMTRAGIAHARKPALAIGALVFALTLWAASVAGLMAGAITLFVCGTFIYFMLTMRIAKRRQQLVRQLPVFLDGIVRLITLGNSVPAAFQAALQTTEAPLRECLDQVSRSLRAGVEIDRALYQVAMIYGTRELELVGSVLRLSVKYGGRADVMLDRMSSFMRDLEQAERELVALSAETRLSSWVLAALPIGIGGFLILTNPGYFSSMWYDPLGRKLVYVAFVLQVIGAYVLHRMAKLRS